MPSVVVFGATGYTGRLVAQALHRRQFPLVLAGRNEDALRTMREELDPTLPIRVADVTDPDSLEAMLAGASVVVTTVGPFIDLGEPVVEAAIDAGVHYIDVTGEQAFQIAMRDRYHGRARSRGVAVLTGHGFEYAFSYCATALLAERFGPLTQIETFHDPGELVPSRGTAKSALAMLGKEAYWVQGGRRVPVDAGLLPGKVWLGDAQEPTEVVPFGGGDVVLLPEDFPSIQSARGYLALPPPEARGAALGMAGRALLRPLLGTALREVLERAVECSISDPSENERKRSKWRVAVRANTARGSHECIVRGPSVYDSTAEVVALTAILLAQAGPRHAGVITTGRALPPAPLLDALKERGIQYRVSSHPRPTEPVTRHEVQTSAIANAPPTVVWKRLLETNTWLTWNERLAGLRGDIREGERAHLVVSGPTGKRLTIPVRVEAVEAERELRWSGGLPHLLEASHYFRLEPAPGNKTRVTHGERFDGALVSLGFPWLEESLERTYQAVTDGLAAEFD